MTSLVLGLALSASQSAVAQPPGYPVDYPPVVRPYRPAPPVVVVPERPAYYPPFAPGEPTPGFPHRPHRKAMTLQEFARCFEPTPGTHHVCLIHPVTCRPVEVCFKLPHGCGCPKVRVNRREIEFDYGRREVEIRFRHNGTVDVDY